MYCTLLYIVIIINITSTQPECQALHCHLQPAVQHARFAAVQPTCSKQIAAAGPIMLATWRTRDAAELHDLPPKRHCSPKTSLFT